jgi:hypothetical protein
MGSQRDTLPHMSPPERFPQNIPNSGLCGSCQHARRMQSDRGSVFLLCQLSFEDSQFAKYPRLPIAVCSGYKPSDKNETSE